MELLGILEGHNGATNYVARLFYDPSERVYVIRYTWQSYTRKYTKTKKIADPLAAQYYFSYSVHMCRRHIGLEPSPLDTPRTATNLPSESMPLPRAERGTTPMCSRLTPAQRNQQRNIIIKLNSSKWKY